MRCRIDRTWRSVGYGRREERDQVEYRMTSGFLLLQWIPLPEDRVYLRRKRVDLERKANSFSCIVLKVHLGYLGGVEDDFRG